MENRPKVGIGVIVVKDSKILIGKRKNAHGSRSWAFPGGHLEFNESWEECAKREVMEETGIQIDNLRFGTTTNDIFEKENKHYITIFMVADFTSGVVETKEPHKCEKWEWFSWNNLPRPLFIPFKNLLKTKLDPLDLP
ncbi:MAG: NUDIX hydrolase [Patescibacteria group bacterium]|nr:NUDIX hydrolase [Patescibacteria group bacterium]